MESMQVFLTIMGVLVGAVVVFFIYNVFIANASIKGKNIAVIAERALKKDMSPKCARCTFYMNNDYDNGYSQSEWLKLFRESVTDKESDKNSQEYAEAVAPFINAIVVDEGNYYVRRGMEKMGYNPFSPGYNDRISLNYFVEPYEYVKNEVRRTSSTQTRTTTATYDSSASDLRKAEKAYTDAVYKNKKYKGTSWETYYEAQEKKAYAALLGAQAKCAGKK